LTPNTLTFYSCGMRIREKNKEKSLRSGKCLRLFVFLRDIVLFVGGVWFFEFFLDYTFPESENLLLYFVAIPIIWSTLIHIWTVTSYREQKTVFMVAFTHLISVMLFISTVFLVSATLNTMQDSLGLLGSVLFHFVGWTVIISLIYYDMVDINRDKPQGY